jgi:nucleoside-diphosphate-sugar epimerase
VPYDLAYPEGGFEDMRRRVPCICKISRLIGWSPAISIDEMIARTIGHAGRQPALPAMLFSPEPVLSASILQR